MKPEITMRVTQFNKGNGGGSATVWLIGKPESALDREPVYSIDLGYHVRNHSEYVSPTQKQILIALANKPPKYVTVSFFHCTPPSESYKWPDWSEYASKVATMIARMDALSELSSLEDVVPTVL